MPPRTPADPKPEFHACAPDAAADVVSIEQAQLMAEIFKVMGDPSRVRIVHALLLSEFCVSDLATALGMNESTVSHQLRTLRQLQVVRTRRDGKLVYYQLHDGHIRRIFEQTLDHVFEREAADGEPRLRTIAREASA